MKKWNSKTLSRRQGGFTLIEMLVATILAGVLASFAYQQYTVAVQNAQERNVQAALQAVASAETSYAMSHHGQMGQITDLINAGLLANATLNNMPYNITIPAAGMTNQGGGLPTGGARWPVVSPPANQGGGGGGSSGAPACIVYATPTEGNLPGFYIDNAQRIQQGNCGENLVAGNGPGGTGTGGTGTGGTGKGGTGGTGPGGTGHRGGGCFVAGTPVRTPSGDKAIDQVRPGDVVYAADPASYALVPEKVAHIEVKTVDVLLEVALGNGTKFQVTPIHRFYDPATGAFKEIGRFKAGDRVALLKLPEASGLTAVDPAGETWYPAMEWDIRIASIKKLPFKATKVYNLHMGGRFHDYLVHGVLVHNMKIRWPWLY